MTTPRTIHKPSVSGRHQDVDHVEVDVAGEGASVTPLAVVTTYGTAISADVRPLAPPARRRATMVGVRWDHGRPHGCGVVIGIDFPFFGKRVLLLVDAWGCAVGWSA